MLNVLYAILSQNIIYEYQFRVACIGYSVVRDKYYVHNIREISRYKLIVQVPSERINVYECCFLKKIALDSLAMRGWEKNTHIDQLRVKTGQMPRLIQRWLIYSVATIRDMEV